MLKKNYSKTGKVCRVTFKYENREQAKKAVLAGDFNSWSTDEAPMKKLKDGSFSLTLSLPTGGTFAFRYIIDGDSWVNDSGADGYTANEFGEENSLVKV
ncbi:MAG: glycoside hydrolase [Desulfobulbus propionicus]|nr:MAG: glycoside hydrolase [Desulfobulbus propionicus]